MKRLRPCYSILLLLIGMPLYGFAQHMAIEISMIDTMAYSGLNTAHIPDARYPVANLVDGRLNTCWVSRLGKDFNGAVAYLEIPDNLFEIPEIMLHAGYWKSARLYEQNARPKKIKLTFYYAFVPDGFVSENGYLSFAYKLPPEKIIVLTDSMVVQRFKLAEMNLPLAYLDSLKRQFMEERPMPILMTKRIIGLEIIEAYPGTRYPDICLSEVYFNDSFVPDPPVRRPKLTRVYLNDEEHTILVDTDNTRGQPVYQDTNAILQLVQTSADLRWALVIAMPTEVDGRAETIYQLIDLFTGKSVIPELTNQFPDIRPDMEIYLEEEKGMLYLVQWQFDQEVRVSIREIF